MKRSILAFLTFGILVTACADKVSQEELIQAALQLRIDQWKETQRTQCREQAILRAETYVDSFLLANSLDMKLDTIPNTDKPVKPPKPVFREKPDSLKVKEVIPEKK